MVRQFLQGHPTDALRKTAFDLAEVNQLIHRSPEIVHDLDRRKVISTSQNVNFRLDNRGAVDMIGKRSPLLFLGIKPDVRGRVKRVLGEADSVEIRMSNHLFPGPVGRLIPVPDFTLPKLKFLIRQAQFLSDEPLEALQNGLSRKNRCVSIQVRSGARRARRHVCNAGGVGTLKPYSTRRNSKLFCRDIDHLGVHALPHLHASCGDADTPVPVDVYKRRSLIEEGLGERDTETNRHDRKPLLLRLVLGVKSISGTPHTGPVEFFDGPIPRRVSSAALGFLTIRQ